MEKTAGLVREISVASSEQSTSIGLINRAVQQLNDVTQKYAASAEELATTSQQLASKSDELKESISFFKTENVSKPQQRIVNKPKPIVKKVIAPEPTPIQPLFTDNSKGTIINLKDNGRDSDFEKF